MAIKCANCKGRHDTIAEVKACHEGPDGRGLEPPVTERQATFIRDLVAKRVDHGITGADALLKTLNKNTASKLISALLGKPKAPRSSSNPGPGAAGRGWNPGIVVEGTVPKPGTYTIAGEGWHRTFRIRKPHPDAKWVGVEYLYGPDNTNSFKRFGKVVDKGVELFSDHNDNTELIGALTFLLNLDDKSLQEAGYKYALESGNCYRCGRKLTVPSSIHRGLGPVCAGKDAEDTARHAAQHLRTAASPEGGKGLPNHEWRDDDTCEGGKCKSILELCSKHQARYQRKHGRASNE